MFKIILKASFIFIITGLFSCKENSTEQKLEKQELSYHERYMKEISEIKKKSQTSIDNMVFVKGGEFLMGATSKQARADEYPVHSEKVADFYIDNAEVTNAKFESFIKATGYVTTAERPVDKEHIAKISGVDALSLDSTPSGLVFTGNPKMWWQVQKGANWRHPKGPKSNIIGKEDYPVVQVSWYDALAYCQWIGKRLPTEEEFEFVARNRGKRTKYTWGNDYEKAIEYVNFHQGTFPTENLVEDKFEGLAPVKSFKNNKLGVYDISGNVWEWTLNSYFDDGYNKKVNEAKVIREEDISPWQRKVIRGGSFLCNESYCSGYRVSARMNSSPDTGLEHLGFRCVINVKQNK